MRNRLLFVLSTVIALCIVLLLPSCTEANKVDKTSESSDHIHEYVETVVPPTCAEQGYTAHSCTGCNYTYADNYVAATGLHDYHDGVCSVCGKISDAEASDSSDHTHEYVETVVPPTCTEQGYTIHTCTECDDTYADNYVAATGLHDYHDGVCLVCGKKETFSIVFYLEDGETVYHSATVESGGSVLLPDEPKDPEKRKEFQGWGKREGDVFSETAYAFAAGGTTLVNVTENMAFRALFSGYIYTPICP